MAKKTYSIHVDIEEYQNWSRRATACHLSVSQWISQLIHLALAKDMDKPFLRYDPNRIPATPKTAPPPPPQVLDTRPRAPWAPWQPPSDPIQSPLTGQQPMRSGYTLEDWRKMGTTEEELQVLFGEYYTPPKT